MTSYDFLLGEEVQITVVFNFGYNVLACLQPPTTYEVRLCGKSLNLRRVHFTPSVDDSMEMFPGLLTVWVLLTWYRRVSLVTYELGMQGTMVMGH